MGNAQVNYNKKKKNVFLQFMIDYYDKISFLKVKNYLRERERENYYYYYYALAHLGAFCFPLL